VATTTSGHVFPGSLIISNLAVDVQTWVNDSTTNFGWIVKGEEEQTLRSAKLLAAREHPNAIFRPTLRVFYSSSINSAPTVRLTTQDDIYKYQAPAKVMLQAAANDADGTISQVEFYNGSDLVHTEYQPPYGFSWWKVPVGEYTLTAKAFDNKGTATISAPISVTVAPPLPSRISSRLASEDNKPEVKGLTLAPNPVYRTLQIFTEQFQNEQATFSILSASGQVLRTLQTRSSNQPVQLDVSFLASGVYTLQVISGNKVWYDRFIKL
jgi:hypothetical protein